MCSNNTQIGGVHGFLVHSIFCNSFSFILRPLISLLCELGGSGGQNSGRPWMCECLQLASPCEDDLSHSPWNHKQCSASLWLLHSGCCTLVASLWSLHSGCCTLVASLWWLHSGRFTLVAAQIARSYSPVKRSFWITNSATAYMSRCYCCGIDVHQHSSDSFNYLFVHHIISHHKQLEKDGTSWRVVWKCCGAAPILLGVGSYGRLSISIVDLYVQST